MAGGGRKKRELDEDQLRLRVGAVAILFVLGALAATVFFQGKHFGRGVTVDIELGQLGNIVIGTPVKVSGRQIGQVDRVSFAPKSTRQCQEISPFSEPIGEAPRVVVTIWVRAGEAHRLRQNSEFFINQGSLLAPQFIEVMPPPREVAPGPRLPPGAVVCGTTPPRTDRLLSRSLENMKILRETVREQGPAMTRFVVAAYRLYWTIESLPADPEQPSRIAANIRRAVDEGEALFDAVTEGADLATLQRAARRFSRLMTAIDDDLRKLSEQVATTQANLSRLASIAPPARRRALREAIATFREALERGRQIMRTANRIAEAVANAEGTLGLMLADKELFDDFKEMNRLMKEQPFRAMGVPPPVVEER